jgi:glycosyltransferase involved in cell wall biosynthesis
MDGKSKLGFNLLDMDSFFSKKWDKICTFQFPEGQFNPPKTGINEPNKKALVSIIIATFGRKELLKRCINSLFSYTKTPFETIIIDNGSSDGTSELIKQEMKLYKNIRYVRQKTNLGYIKAINIGIARAIGDYIVLFDDDAHLLGIEDENKDWLESYIEELDEQTAIIGNKFKNKSILGINVPLLQCVMFKREIVDNIGYFDESFVNYGGDEDFAMRIKIKGLSGKEKKVKLEHKDNLIPIEVKKRELITAESKLRKKYEGVLNGRSSNILSRTNGNANSTIPNN